MDGVFVVIGEISIATGQPAARTVAPCLTALFMPRIKEQTPASPCIAWIFCVVSRPCSWAGWLGETEERW